MLFGGRAESHSICEILQGLTCEMPRAEDSMADTPPQLTHSRSPTTVGHADDSDKAVRDPRQTRKRLAILDGASAFAVVIFVTVLTQGWGGLINPEPFAIGLIGAIAVVAALAWQNAYMVTRSVAWDGNYRLAWNVAGLVTLGMVALSWLLAIDGIRLWQLLITAGWLVFLTMWRVLFTRAEGDSTETVRVIVAGNTGDALATRLALRADGRTSYEVQGFVMDTLDDDVPEIVAQMALGSIDQLSHVVKKTGADLVVVCLGALDAERFAPLVRELNILGVDVALSTGLSNVALRRVSLGNISGRPLVQVTPAPISGWHMAVKRAVDVVGALCLLGASGLLMVLISVAIRIEDGESAIFSQTRVGKGGRPFTIYKFRTMFTNAEAMLLDLTSDHEGPVFKMRNDPRITRVGAVLRKTSLDELPQLFNILRGEMSLVGPRPLPVHEVEAAPVSFLDRHMVKPGLTGRWQVSGRSDTGFDELDELDRWYVENWSLGQDLEILARTVPAVLMARGAR